MTNESSKPGSAGERRRHRRFPFVEDVLLDGTRRCTTADISEEGLYISTIQAFEENALIDFTIPSIEKSAAMKARVRHCQPGIGFGLMFVDLSDEQKAKIMECIEKLRHRAL